MFFFSKFAEKWNETSGKWNGTCRKLIEMSGKWNGTCGKWNSVCGKSAGMCRKWNVSDIFREITKYEPSGNMPFSYLVIQVSNGDQIFSKFSEKFHFQADLRRFSVYIKSTHRTKK